MGNSSKIVIEGEIHYRRTLNKTNKPEWQKFLINLSPHDITQKCDVVFDKYAKEIEEKFSRKIKSFLSELNMKDIFKTVKVGRRGKEDVAIECIFEELSKQNVLTWLNSFNTNNPVKESIKSNVVILLSGKFEEATWNIDIENTVNNILRENKHIIEKTLCDAGLEMKVYSVKLHI